VINSYPKVTPSGQTQVAYKLYDTFILDGLVGTRRQCTEPHS